MDSDVDLPSLMALYQKGDAAAANTLINGLSPRLHRFFLMQFVSRRYADDLLQETWMRLHEVRHTYRPGQSVLPWLYAIARNIRVDHYRKVQRVETREQALDPHTDLPALTPRASTDASSLETLLATLPESQREVIVMLKVAEMSLEEVARAKSVIFVDCATDSAPGEVRAMPVEPVAENSKIGTHHLEAGQLLALSKQLYGAMPRASLLLTVGAGSLELREGFSQAVTAALPEASSFLEQTVLRLVANSHA